ncbi:16S rRNA (adenine(1518)-N(6)/adenine(1519)-N(6))-dimethyltransferase, partial [Candidatus Micrarchaeota archaeon CG_4_10_14_0_8_um_filter_60_7]
MRPKKRLSQVFLIAPAVARLIAEAVPLKGKRVLEVGAGRGILTRELAERAA